METYEDIKLIACDMDGTLLDERSQVPPETFDLVRVLDAAGILLALPRLPGDGSTARYGARAQEPAVRVQHGGGDRRRPEIKAQMIHIDPSSVFQWE